MTVVRDTGDTLRLEYQAALRYAYAAGHYASTFMTALRDEGRILGVRDPGTGKVLVPPRVVSGLSAQRTGEWVEVGPRGTVIGATVVQTAFVDPMTGEERPIPYGFAFIRLDGADTSIYHFLEASRLEDVRVGMRVEAVLKPREEREGQMSDIVWFATIDDEQVEGARSAVPPAAEELVFDQQINMPYRYTAGASERAFLGGLAQRRIFGSRAGDRVLVPARPFAPDGSRTGELVEVADTGVLEGWTTRAGEGGARTFGLIRLDGADTALLHLVDADPERLEPGLRVRARWAAEPAAEITAIEAFEPVQESVRGIQTNEW